MVINDTLNSVRGASFRNATRITRAHALGGDRLHTAWRPLLQKARCLVVVNGFIEFRSAYKKEKHAAHFCPANDELFFLAGMYNGDRFTIVTTEPNKIVAPIHDRMPVILDRAGAEIWLSEQGPEASGELLAPAPDDVIRIEWLHANVNNSRCKDPYVIVDPPPEQLSLL